MTIDDKINLGLRLVFCVEQWGIESCKGCPYGDGEERTGNCKEKLYADVVKAMTTHVTDDHNQMDAEDMVSQILIEIGVNARNSGYQYLQEAITYAVYTPTATKCLVKELYPHVGEVFGISGPAAERAMRTAITNAVDKFGFEHVARTMGLQTHPCRTLTTSEFISTIAGIVRRKIEKN